MPSRSSHPNFSRIFRALLAGPSRYRVAEHSESLRSLPIFSPPIAWLLLWTRTGRNRPPIYPKSLRFLCASGASKREESRRGTPFRKNFFLAVHLRVRGLRPRLLSDFYRISIRPLLGCWHGTGLEGTKQDRRRHRRQAVACTSPEVLRQISGVSPRRVRSQKRARTTTREIFFLPVRPAPSALARRDLRHLSGVSPDRSIGWAHVFKTLLPDIEVFVEAPRCLAKWGGLATAAPFMARMEAFLGIIPSGDEIVALPGSILAPASRGSAKGTNAGSNRWAIHRSVRGRRRQPLKFQVIACARGSDGR